MNLTPLDVRKAAFRKVIRGVDPEEVTAFLEVVAENYEQVLQDNAKLTERVQGLEERIQQYQGMERLLQDSMLTAERLAAESRDTSRQESERRIQEAQKRAERILEDSRERLRNLNREIVELSQRKDLYVQRFRSLIEAQLLYLEDHQQDMAEIDELGQGVADLLVQDAGNQEEPNELDNGSDRIQAPGSVPVGSLGVAESDMPEETAPLAESSVEAGMSGPAEWMPSEEPVPEEDMTPTGEIESVRAADVEEEEGHASRRGFFPPRVRRQGFFDLNAEGDRE
jgi:cell division initiation protein